MATWRFEIILEADSEEEANAELQARIMAMASDFEEGRFDPTLHGSLEEA